MPREFPQPAQAIGQIELTAGVDTGGWRPATLFIISHIFRQCFSTFFGNSAGFPPRLSCLLAVGSAYAAPDEPGRPEENQQPEQQGRAVVQQEEQERHGTVKDVAAAVHEGIAQLGARREGPGREGLAVLLVERELYGGVTDLTGERGALALHAFDFSTDARELALRIEDIGEFAGALREELE